MRYLGIDLHKYSITICVHDATCHTVRSYRFACAETARLRAFFASCVPFQAVVEATASYLWLWELIEPLAQRVVLANSKKLRIIAESTNKSDKVDARVLADFLARDLIREAYRPTPRQREHRTLVRHRQFLQKMRTQVRNKVRQIVANVNADRRDLFTRRGLEALAEAPLCAADRYAVEDLLAQLADLEARLTALKRQLAAFAQAAPELEQRQRALLRSIPGVGPVTIDVVLAELGTVSRFPSAKQVTAYAGLAPGRRESAGKARDLGITKHGPSLLRWILVEAAWRTIRGSDRYRALYERLKRRRGARRAIVALARRLLELIYAVLRDEVPYTEASPRRAA